MPKVLEKSKVIKPYLLSMGNTKLSKNVGVFSLPRIITCPGRTELCTKVCYAKKAEVQYAAVRAKRTYCLAMSKRKDFVARMIAEITHRKIKLIRLHEDGDVYSQGYLYKLFEICTALPAVRFLMYTKSFMLDWSGKPGNLSVYWSIDKTTTMTPPYPGKTATLVAAKDMPPHGAVTCSLPRIKKKQVNYCGTFCLHCWANLNDVYFLQH